MSGVPKQPLREYFATKDTYTEPEAFLKFDYNENQLIKAINMIKSDKAIKQWPPKKKHK